MNHIDIATRRQRERLRQEFCPEAVRLLFIGESPSVSGSSSIAGIPVSTGRCGRRFR